MDIIIHLKYILIILARILFVDLENRDKNYLYFKYPRVLRKKIFPGHISVAKLFKTVEILNQMKLWSQVARWTHTMLSIRGRLFF